MGHCNFTSKSGVLCSCTSGSCTSEIDMKGREEHCDECGHKMSLHSDYSKNFTLQSNVLYWCLFKVAPAPAPHLPKKSILALDYPDISPRSKTVETLAGILETKRVVHVRGTPSSGKTTLANLLYQYYKDRGKAVVLIDGWHNIPDPTTHLVNRCIISGYDEATKSNLLNLDLVFLFDEAQQSYQDLTLWLGIIKTQSCRTNGPRICLFSSYGSPTTGPTQYPHGSTPIYFGGSQRVSISVSRTSNAPNISLFYNEEEFSEVMRLRCADPRHRFAINSAASDYLYSITNGHPGVVTSLLGYLFLVCRSKNYTSKN